MENRGRAAGRMQLNLETFDLAEAARGVADRLREQVQRTGSTLSLAGVQSAPGCWDRLRIEQVVTNLLGNALKYAAGTPVDIAVSGNEQEVTLTVSDQGPGIPESEWDRIFLRFERAASMRNFGGLGLGLYVARQIIDAHGGDIRLARPSPKGAHFVIRLPRSPSLETVR